MLQLKFQHASGQLPAPAQNFGVAKCQSEIVLRVLSAPIKRLRDSYGLLDLADKQHNITRTKPKENSRRTKQDATGTSFCQLGGHVSYLSAALQPLQVHSWCMASLRALPSPMHRGIGFAVRPIALCTEPLALQVLPQEKHRRHRKQM